MRANLSTPALMGAAWLAILPALPAHAVDGPSRLRVEGVAADDVLYLRERPDAGARAVGSLPPGTAGLENLGCVTARGGQTRPEANLAAAGTWCRVRFRAAEGYASARFLRADAAAGPAYPAEVGARIAEAERACRAKGRTWKARADFVRPATLGEGRDGWLLSDRGAGCGEDGRGLCEGNLCRMQVLVSRADGALVTAFDAPVLAYRLRDAEGRPVLQVHQQGAACGRAGVEECWRALELRGDALVPAR